MNNLKIIVCTTFRDFNGSENDEIQKRFLKSLGNQTYKNFELVVTLFGEKNVQNEVEKFSFKSSFLNSNAGEFRYSLTKVILNTHNYAERNSEDYIIFWTTCDVIYEKNFFEIIIKNYKKNVIGTSHPHTTFSSLKNFEENIENKAGKLFSGFDLIYFDKSFLNNEIVNIINDYKFNDWGVFEHFLISLNEFSRNCHMINIYEEAKICKIENDRELTNEPSQFLVNSHKLNSVVFNKFLKDKNITNEYFDLAYCHFKFTLTANKIRHSINFRSDILDFIVRRLRRKISQVTPEYLKKIIRGKK